MQYEKQTCDWYNKMNHISTTKAIMWLAQQKDKLLNLKICRYRQIKTLHLVLSSPYLLVLSCCKQKHQENLIRDIQFIVTVIILSLSLSYNKKTLCT